MSNLETGQTFTAWVLLESTKITSFKETRPKNTILSIQKSYLLCWAWSCSWWRLYNKITRWYAYSLSLWK